jgi:hypothetical protein
MTPCDPKEYQHLLYDKRKFKGRVNDSSCVGRYHFFILKSKSPEEQSSGHNHYHVALLNTGELVCVNNGYPFIMDGVKKDRLYIGEGVVHHNEYW